jgi:hypothetical protein
MIDDPGTSVNLLIEHHSHSEFGGSRPLMYAENSEEVRRLVEADV